MRPLFYLEFDGVCNEKYRGGEVKNVLERLKQTPGLCLGDPEFIKFVNGLFDEHAKAHLKTLDDEIHPVYVLFSGWRHFMNRAALNVVLKRGGLAFVAESFRFSGESIH